MALPGSRQTVALTRSGLMVHSQPAAPARRSLLSRVRASHELGSSWPDGSRQDAVEAKPLEERLDGPREAGPRAICLPCPAQATQPTRNEEDVGYSCVLRLNFLFVLSSRWHEADGALSRGALSV